MSMHLKALASIPDQPTDQPKMPVLFVGHGNPMNALLENDITAGWKQMTAGLKPTAVLCISAHWETGGTRVTMAPQPATIHDFGGFPPELFAVRYPAPGSPDLGHEIIEKMKPAIVLEDHQWGLDHGTWSVIKHMFPEATIPVLQLSLDRKRSLRDHYELAQELAFLRRRGVLIVGSGNLVHNIGRAKWDSDTPYDWATEFDEQVKDLILDGNHAELIGCAAKSRAAALSIPTREHYLPLLYALALQDKAEKITFFNESILMGSMSMRSFVVS